MDKLKRTVAVIAAVLMLFSGITVFGEEPQEPELENEMIDPAGAEVEEQPEMLDVLLPYDISFDIVISGNNHKGFITSREFKIINKGDNAATVSISSIELEIEDENDFSVAKTAELPEDGNNIYIELLCSSNGSFEALPVMNSFDGAAYTYYLGSGDTGTFRLDGVVNEFGDSPWSDTNVKVSIRFSMEDHGTVIGPLKAHLQAMEEDSGNATTSESEKEASDSSAAPESQSSPESEADPTPEDTSEPEQSDSEEETSQPEDSRELDKDDETEPPDKNETEKAPE